MTEDLSAAIGAATTLRNAGIRTQIHTEQKKFKQKLSYADKLGIPYVVLLGEDEIAQNKVALKDLTTGQQQLISVEEAIELVKAGLIEKNSGAPIREK